MSDTNVNKTINIKKHAPIAAAGAAVALTVNGLVQSQKRKNEAVASIESVLPDYLSDEERKYVARAIYKNSSQEEDNMDNYEILAMYEQVYGMEALDRISYEAVDELNKEAALRDQLAGLKGGIKSGIAQQKDISTYEKLFKNFKSPVSGHTDINDEPFVKFFENKIKPATDILKSQGKEVSNRNMLLEAFRSGREQALNSVPQKGVNKLMAVEKQASNNDILEMYCTLFGKEAFERLAREAAEEINKEAADTYKLDGGAPSFTPSVAPSVTSGGGQGKATPMTKEDYENSKKIMKERIDKVVNAVNELPDKADKFVGNVSNTLSNFTENTTNFMNSIPDKGNKLAKDIENKVKDTANDIKDKAVESAKKIPDKAGKFVKEIPTNIDKAIKDSLPSAPVLSAGDKGISEPARSALTGNGVPERPEVKNIPTQVVKEHNRLMEPEREYASKHEVKSEIKSADPDKLSKIKDYVADKATLVKDTVSDVVKDNPIASGIAAGATGVLGLGLLGKGMAKAIAKKRIPKEVLAAINEEIIDELIKNANYDENMLKSADDLLSSLEKSIGNGGDMSLGDTKVLTEIGDTIQNGLNNLDTDDPKYMTIGGGLGVGTIGAGVGATKLISAARDKIKKKAEYYAEYMSKFADSEDLEKSAEGEEAAAAFVLPLAGAAALSAVGANKLYKTIKAQNLAKYTEMKNLAKSENYDLALNVLTKKAEDEDVAGILGAGVIGTGAGIGSGVAIANAAERIKTNMMLNKYKRMSDLAAVTELENIADKLKFGKESILNKIPTKILKKAEEGTQDSEYIVELLKNAAEIENVYADIIDELYKYED